jgi:hypothetical protein
VRGHQPAGRPAESCNDTNTKTNANKSTQFAMKPREIFGLCVRIVGLLGLIIVVNHLINDLVAGHGVTLAEAIKRAGYIVVGIYLLLGAPQLVKLSFPEAPGTSADPAKT